MSLTKPRGQRRLYHFHYYHQGYRYWRSLKISDKKAAMRIDLKLTEAIDADRIRKNNWSTLRKLPIVDVMEWLDSEKKDYETLPFREALEEYFTRMSPHWSEKTQSTNKLRMRAAFLPFFRSRPLSRITSADLDDYAAHRHGKVSNETINKELSSLRKLVRVMAGKKLNIEYLPAAKKPARALMEAEQGKLENACRQSMNKDLADVVIVALDTGPRAGELLNLRVKDFLHDQKMVSFTATKTGTFRHVPLTERVFAILRRRAKGKRTDDFLFGRTWNSRGEKGKPYQSLRGALNAAYKRASLSPKRPFHTLRHTFASRLTERGASPYHIKLLMGHSQLSTTELYQHLNPEFLRGTIDVLGKSRSKIDAKRRKRKMTSPVSPHQ